MAAGTVYTEIDLDSRKFDAAQKRILYDAKTMAVNVEDAWKNLGQKSDVMYNAMRQQATNAYALITSDSKSSTNEIVRAEEAKNAKLKALNEQQFGHQTSMIEGLKKNWMALSVAAVAAFYTMQKFYDLAERGAKVRAFEESFTVMARNFNIAGDALIKKMEEMTKGTVDNSDLMAKALRLISEGFSEKQIVVISEAARVSARLTGKTVSEAYEQISDSLLNLRSKGLKTAGIIIDLDKAEQQHAATLGVGKEQLSDYGRRMAWASAIMEKTKEDAAKLGDSLDKLNEYEKFQKAKATWKDFGDTISKVASGIAADVLTILNALRDLYNYSSSGLPKLPGTPTSALGGKEMGYGDLLKWMFGDQATKHKMAAERMPSYEAPPGGIIGKEAEQIKTGGYPEWRTIVGEERVQAEKDYWEALHKTWEIENNLIRIEGERAQQLADDMFPSMEKVRQIQDQMTEGAEKLRIKLVKLQNLVIDFGWEDYASGAAEASSAAERALNKLAIANTPSAVDENILNQKVDFYSQLSGFEDEYRKFKLEWIDREAKKLKEAGISEVAIAKWTAQEKKKINSDIYLKENEDRQEAFSSMAQNFAQMAMLYKEDSTARTTLSALSKAATIAEIAVQAEKNLMIAVGAVVQQGTGDPYTAFARIAAMIAVVSSVLQIVGIAFSGSGGGHRSYSSGGTALGTSTTVLGGATGEASDSARKSLELLEDTYTMEYRELTNIYDEMKSLNRNITGLVSSIVRGGGIGGAESYGVDVGLTQSWAQKVGEKWMTSTKLATIGFVFGGLIGAVIGYVVGWLWKGIFGGGKTITVGGTGIQLGAASVGGLLGGEGMTAQQYADIKEKKEGGWFHGTSRKYYTLYQALDEDVTRLLTKVFVDLGATLVELSIALGTDTQATLNYVFPGGKINLAGLDAEGIDKAISQFISGAADDAIDALFGQMLRSYQQVGEGLLETAVRLVIDKEIILDTLKMTGQAFVGTTSEIIAFSEAIIEMAGDLKTLREAAETYYNKFFDDVEKQMRLQDQLTRVLLDMNMLLPSTREGYRHLVEGLDLTTEAGQRTYVSLLTLAEGADAYYKYLEEAAADALTVAQDALAAAQSALSVAEQNLRDAFEAEKKRINEAYQIELAGMNKSLDNTQNIISDLQRSVDKLRSAKDRMVLVDTIAARNEYRVAQSIIAAILSQARMGDLSGIENIDKSLETLTAITPEMYANSVDYKRDFYKAYSSIEELEKLTGNQLSIEEQAAAAMQTQIDLLRINNDIALVALDTQLNALLGINTSVLSIVDAINALGIAQAAVTTATAAVTTATTTTATTTPDAIEQLYQLVFNRLPDIGGEAFYEAQLAGGKDISRIAAELYGSPEYAAIKAVRGYASGGFHPGGLRLVGEKGPELEYTGPSNIIPFSRFKSDGNVELVAEVRALREDIKRGNFKTEKRLSRIERYNETWDVTGLLTRTS